MVLMPWLHPMLLTHTHPFSLALCPAWCVRLSTTCFAASATNTQHAPFAQQPPHNNQPLALQPHHLLPQHTQHHNTTNQPPVGHCVALPTTKSCHGLPHCCAPTTHLSGHLLLSTHTTRSVSWLHHTQHNPAPQACASVGVWCTVVGLHTHSFCVGFTTPQTPCAGSSMCHAHTNCTTNTHSLVWCTMPCNHTTHMVVVVVCGAVVGVGLLAQPPSLLVMPSMWCAAPVSSHHNLVPSSTHTLCHPHNNNHHCTVWCHLGNNHQPTNHANQPHSWRVVCGVVCCT